MLKLEFVILALNAYVLLLPLANISNRIDDSGSKPSRAKKKKTEPLVENPIGNIDDYHKIKFPVGTTPSLYIGKKHINV